MAQSSVQFLDFRIRVMDYDKFDSAITQYSELTGESLKRVVRRESRGVLQTVYRYTPPRNEEQGNNAIARDLMRVFSPVSSGLFDTIWEATGGARQAHRVMRRKDGTTYLIDWRYISQGPQDMARFHAGKRISRGRVQHAGSLGSMTRDIGRWKEDSRMVVPHGDFSRYLKTVQARVGLGKSGWLPAMQSLGIPAEAYVTRHGAGNGAVVNNLDSDTDPYILATNKVGYMAKNTRFIDNAVKSRRRFLEAEIEKMLAGNVAASGL